MKTYGSKRKENLDLFDGGSDILDYGLPAHLPPPIGKKSPPCYTTHKPLVLGGGTVYGGSCIHPVIPDADVYIGLDTGMTVLRYLPWEKVIQQVLYPVTDMAAPSDPAGFKKLVEFVCNQLRDGKTVHLGCIGGHGRTGTLLSAVHKVVTGEADSISMVRKVYCKKAVESMVQVSFLHKHFGIDKVDGFKEKSGVGYFPAYGNAAPTPFPTKQSGVTAFANASKVYNHVASKLVATGVLF